MNTDNMSILGLTIDYGPYGWLDNYDPNWTPNTTDADERRYRFGQQPEIAYWNLGQLANALYSLFKRVEPLQEGMNAFVDTFNQGWQTMMASKLGITSFRAETDDQLIKELLIVLQLAETDMTLFYRKLAVIDAESGLDSQADADALIDAFKEIFYSEEQLSSEYRDRFCRWLRNYIGRVQQDAMTNENRRIHMNAVNPKFVLRNYLAQLAVDEAAQGDFNEINELFELMRHPYDEQPGQEKYAAKPDAPLAARARELAQKKYSQPSYNQKR